MNASTILGSLIVVALGVLIQLLRDVSGKLTTLGEEFVRLATHVGIDGNGLTAKVDALQQASSAEAMRERGEMQAELRMLREREAVRAAADRRSA
jgi:hypothetical protein